MADSEKRGQEGSISDTGDLSDVIERESKKLGGAVRASTKTPAIRVILRLIPIVLLICAVAIFVTGLLHYGELERERDALISRIDELEEEVEELEYLLDSPVDYEYIIRVAREKLGLHLPDEIVYYNDTND